ncbi:hypothetical protein ACTOB_003694 [Actinoplanes oblitus]|uniref:Uncharacterized protein n=1 Tax=Actinoplanes oblitus TaxID=3040509 RepID=A0ABY8WTQ4_9ACTN|nr:hypothetical protein [Actinoplanes oblitus]WIN00019.1 hypothetical protein ACTOB_003694 [Actinoplanes oblitus]
MTTVFIATLTATITTTAALPDAVGLLTSGALYPPGDGLIIAGVDGIEVTTMTLTVGIDDPAQPVLGADMINGDRIEPAADLYGLAQPAVCIPVATADSSDDCARVYDATSNDGDSGRRPACAGHHC